jgi:drug/metabolite transporter (DMT)-like permease
MNAPALAPSRLYAAGVAIVVLAGILLSTGGLILRHMEAASPWQVLFYRSVAMAAAGVVLVALQYRGDIIGPFRRMGAGGLLAGTALAISMTGYVFSVMLTTVANAMFIVSSAPFFAALLAWLLLRERVRPATWLTIAAAMTGIGVMFVDGMAGHGLSGLTAALVCAVSYAVLVVLLRRFRNVDMLPALTTASLLLIIVAGIMAEDLAAPLHDVLLACLMGVAQTGAGFFLIMLGARSVPAAEVSLLLLIEIILSPIWVWIVFAEVPTDVALIGGLIVFAAVAMQAVIGVVWERRLKAA